MDRVRYTVDENHNVQEIHRVVVHRFIVNEHEDPDIHAARPMWQWRESEAGQYVIKLAVSHTEWQRYLDHLTLGYHYVIIAELEKKKLSEFYLRFGKINA